MYRDAKKANHVTTLSGDVHHSLKLSTFAWTWLDGARADDTHMYVAAQTSAFESWGRGERRHKYAIHPINVSCRARASIGAPHSMYVKARAYLALNGLVCVVWSDPEFLCPLMFLTHEQYGYICASHRWTANASAVLDSSPCGKRIIVLIPSPRTRFLTAEVFGRMSIWFLGGMSWSLLAPLLCFLAIIKIYFILNYFFFFTKSSGL